MSTRRELTAFVSSLPLLVGIAAATPALAAGYQGTIKIGIIAPLTGGGAPWGMAEEWGGRILANEINAKGGLDIAGKKYKIVMIPYDDQYKAADAIAAYNRLLNVDHAKYMIVLATPSTLALKQAIERDNVLALTSSGTVQAVSHNDKHLVRAFSILADYIPPFYAWLRDHLKERRVAIINPNDASGWDSTKVSAKYLKQSGFEVVDEENFERAQNDFSPMITRMMSKNVEILELASTPPATAGLIVRAARELGFKGQIIKGGGPAPVDIVRAAGAKAAEGMYNLLYVNPASPGYQRLAADYKKAVGQEPNELIVSFYDAFNVLVHAIQKGGDPNDPMKARAAFGEVLPMQSIQGVLLNYGGMATTGALNEILTVGFVGQIRNGKSVILDMIQPK